MILLTSLIVIVPLLLLGIFARYKAVEEKRKEASAEAII
jgi:putative copper export protein